MAGAPLPEFGVEVAPLSWFCADVPRRDALLLGYGALTPHEIRAGAATLARALESLTPWHASRFRAVPRTAEPALMTSLTIAVRLPATCGRWP